MYVQGAPFWKTPPTQTCGIKPLHFVSLAVQDCTQLPPLHTLAQAEPATHCPLASHVFGVLPSQSFVVGAQTPVQVPAPLQMNAQGAPSIQAPVPSHVCGIVPLHCMAPGVHPPTHAPFWHAKAHCVSVLVVRSGPHTTFVVPLHSASPGLAPTHSAICSWHDPCQVPVLVSQSIDPEQLCSADHC
jgi:hypothetical protein